LSFNPISIKTDSATEAARFGLQFQIEDYAADGELAFGMD